MKRWPALAVFIAATLASLRPIRSYDYFWHLATGRWIVAHHGLPATDPFALASARLPWINGEWLFQIILYPLQQAFGHAGISVAIALLAGLVVALGFAVSNRFVSAPFALMLAVLSWFGAQDRFGARPSTVAALLVVTAIIILSSSLSLLPRTLLFAILSALWINVHPSALLAPLLAGLWWLGENFAGVKPRAEEGLRGAILPAFAAIALLANPYGLRGITAPLHLLSSVNSGAFVNAEWLSSRPTMFPFLYLTIVLGALVFVQHRQWRAHTGSFLIAALLAVLAIQHVRNQGLFFAAYPLLVCPAFPPTTARRMKALASAAAALLVTISLITNGLGTGIDNSVFPVSAVRQLQGTGLRGHIYNPDQFGGFLIWSFYPERRVLQDGRNELYADYLREYEAARLDGRKWKALLRKYDLNLAVDEYHRESVDVVDFVTGRHSKVPVSRIYFPKAEWALVGFDDVAMVFARREAFPSSSIAAFEFRHLVPDAIGVAIPDEENATYRQEIAAARRRIGPSRTLDRLEAQLRGQ